MCVSKLAGVRSTISIVSSGIASVPTRIFSAGCRVRAPRVRRRGPRSPAAGSTAPRRSRTARCRSADRNARCARRPAAAPGRAGTRGRSSASHQSARMTSKPSMTPAPRTFFRISRILARQRLEPGPRPLAGAPHLLEIQLVQQREQPHHADRVAFPGGVELLFLLKERRQLLADEQDAVLRLLRPGDDVGRARQIEQLVRPQAAGHAPAGLHLVEDERHVVDARQQPQLAHEPRARQTHAAFALNRLDQHGGHAPRSPDDVGREARALRLDERVRRPGPGCGEELVDRVHLAPVGVLALLRARQPARHQQIPQLLQAALLAARRLLRRARLPRPETGCAASRTSGKPSRAFLRCVTARLPSVRP